MCIVVYGKPMCVQCDATYRQLGKLGIQYDKVDVSQNDEALETIKQLGYQQAPVVIVYNDDGSICESWSGFRPDRLKAAVAVAA